MRKGVMLLAGAVAALAALVLGGQVVQANEGSASLPGRGGGAAVPIKGTCKVTKISFATAESAESTASPSFVDLPGTAVTFRIGGTRPACLEVELSAEAFAPNDAAMTVRALLDGNLIGSPLVAIFAADDNDGGDVGNFAAHAMSFGFVDVPPGVHTVNIQWRSFGGEVQMFVRSLFVHHR
jgi:hypothetical protein